VTLAAGTRLGPYEILSPIGAGGMGEVYRARDSRLNREAAIKVLPADLASDGDRLKRFEKEARSASALNHPNIVTVYDVGTSGGVSWIAMERVEGETLRKLLAAGAIPLRRLLGIATQVAEGLAKAHATGIVHRDLKPENVMVTKEGIVKILDFGLAKATVRESGELTQSPTVSAGTEEGVVLGTVGYMSPEQALGGTLDFRSDQFALGAIVYEMASGKRAFSKASAPETLAAIIRDEPEPLAAAAPAIPLPLRWVVERCLAKDPEERYASTKDLARDLARLREGVGEGSLSGASIAAPAHRRVASAGRILAAAAVLAAGAIGGVLAARRPPAAPPSYRPLTFQRGSLGNARFAPDGQTVVYAARWQGRQQQLYTTRLDSTESTPLPLPSADLASISSSGKLAILIPRDYFRGVVAEVPLAGGAPRELVESGYFYVLAFNYAPACWAPDSDRLAVVREGRLEFPIGKVLFSGKGENSVRYPRFSPDGRSIAFVRGGANGDAIGVVDLDGKSRIVSEGWEFVASLAWHPRTGEIWFSSRGINDKLGIMNLHAVKPSGVHRVVSRSPLLTIVEDISRDGRVLARSDDWPTTMICQPPGQSREVDLTWLDFSEVVDLSDDGQDLVFAETGAGAGAVGGIYMRKTDGASPAVRLGEGIGAQALSPDKRWVVQVTPERLVLLPVGAGEPKTIADADFQYQMAAWFPDGKRLLVGAASQGRGSRMYVRDLSGGSPRPFTPEGILTQTASLSPDGKIAVVQDRDRRWGFYPVEGGEPRPVPGSEPNDVVLRFDSKGDAVFVATGGPVLPMRIDRLELSSGRRVLWKEIMPADPTGVTEINGVHLTPDGRGYCYNYMRAISRLYVVEGLR
jgi:eukaryotic-like serine/threonine-protein kinase